MAGISFVTYLTFVTLVCSLVHAELLGGSSIYIYIVIIIALESYSYYSLIKSELDIGALSSVRFYGTLLV